MLIKILATASATAESNEWARPSGPLFFRMAISITILITSTELSHVFKKFCNRVMDGIAYF